MYCSNCGKEISDDAKFCQFCGAKIQNINENLENKMEVLLKKCSVCGFEYPANKRICPNCTADNIPQEKINDQQNCGQYKKAKEENTCVYKKYCSHKTCEFAKQIYVSNESQFTNESKGCMVIIGIIIVIFILKGVFSVKIWDNSNKNYSKQPHQHQNAQNNQIERQKRLDAINDLINDAHKGGLIIKIDNFDIEDQKCAYMIVDESVWNQLPYESKQQMCQLIREYSDLTGVKILSFKGYRTGKTIMPFEHSVHNF